MTTDELRAIAKAAQGRPNTLEPWYEPEVLRLPAADAAFIAAFDPTRALAACDLADAVKAMLAQPEPSAPEGLDAAWSEAEALVPPGWVGPNFGRNSDGTSWASAYEIGGGMGKVRADGVFATPSAALRALAAKLKEATR